MESELKIISAINNENLIISFGGGINKFGGICPFEFLNFLNKNFMEYDKYFYIDKKINRYHLGIEDISSNIDETVEYLKKITHGYKNITCIGVSAGGYASILFGSLLKVKNVIAFIPPTQINIPGDTRKYDEKYIDLLPLINNSTKYYLYGDLSVKDIYNSHHIEHCNRLKIYPNVVVKEYDNLDIKKLRNDGELLKIFKDVLD